MATVMKEQPPLPVRADWLALHEEPVLEPALPIIDPHHHFYQKPELTYLLDDLTADLGSGHNILATVYLECRSKYRPDGPPELFALGETEWVVQIARQADRGGYGATKVAAGIIGYADLMRGAKVAHVLEAQIAIAEGRFRGIRNSTVSDPDPAAQGSPLNRPAGMLLERSFRQGFATLAPLGLVFDAWLYHTQIEELTDLARAFPDTTIVLDHVGGVIAIGPYAGRRDETFATWTSSMRALAACPNVQVKLGGGGMRLFGFGYHDQARPPSSADVARDFAPYVETCIALFGTKRCMFESNFPVDKCSYSYRVIWNAFKRIAAGCSAAEKADLFHDTAARVYRLPVA